MLSSCLGTRYLNEGESILKKQVIKTGKAVTSDDIESLQAQKPNTRLLVLPFSHLVFLYHIGRNHFDSLGLVQKKEKITASYDSKMEETDSEKKIKKLHAKKIRKLDQKNTKLEVGNLFMRWCEKLSVYDTNQLIQTRTNLDNYLFAHGYFDAEINTLKFKQKNRKTSIRMKIVEGKPYIMDSMIYVIKDPAVASLFHTHIKDQLLDGKQYSQDLISEERDRVYDLLADNGYFDFKRQYILFEVDSAELTKNKLIIRQTIANPPNKSGHKQFKLDSVIFTANSNNSFDPKRSPRTYNGITYDLNNNRFYERVVDWRIFTYPDSLYSKSLTLETQKQLSYLDMFRFVNINHDTTDGKFITNIFTSPLNKYQTSFEGGLSVLENQAQGLPGPFLNFNAKNRNTFKGLEILQFNGNASIQGINNVNKQTGGSSKYSRLQYGGNVSLTFPQFLFPIKGAYQARIGQYNPKTKVSIGVNFEDRFGEYNRTTFNTNMSYSWQVSDNSRLTFSPFDAGYIKSNNSATFKEELDRLEEAGNISYVSAFKSSFVSNASLALDLNFHNYGLGNNDATFIHASLEYGGLAQLFFGKNPLGDSLTHYKYVKGNFDFRQNVRINSKTAFAYRANLGFAYNLGSSKSLPYEKYFFAGGSNSIRAWQPRRLGPGAYARYDSASVVNDGPLKVNYDREEPGDILIELSAELRREFLGIIDYAFFIDAGNVWLWRSKTIEDSQSDYNNGDNGIFVFKNFLEEMAIAAGAGLRLDFSFLVLRLDGAYKVTDPTRSRGDRFVLDELNFRNLGPGSKMNINIGIGYPF